MKKYYLNNKGEESIGPFDFEELRTQKIDKDTLVWTEEMEDWKKAKELKEFKTVFTATPPPINPVPKTKQKGAKKTNFKYLLIGIFVIAILTIGSTIFSKEDENQDSFADDALKTQTRNAITSLVQVDANNYTTHTFGGISNLEIKATNNSDYAIDEITVAINYIKENGGIYKIENLTFQNLQPHQDKLLSAPESQKGRTIKLITQIITSSDLDLCYDKNKLLTIGDPDPFKCY